MYEREPGRGPRELTNDRRVEAGEPKLQFLFGDRLYFLFAV